MSSRRNISGSLAVVSALSGWSLLLLGALSLLFSAFGADLAGSLIGLALLVHGVYELRQRVRLLRGEDAKAARRLAGNQLALAVSVGAYLGWQVLAIDKGRLHALLNEEPLHSLLA